MAKLTLYLGWIRRIAHLATREQTFEQLIQSEEYTLWLLKNILIKKVNELLIAHPQHLPTHILCMLTQ